MEKYYTVFISSTYEDLKEERAAVTRLLLKIHCFPIEMELFSSSNNSQWSDIRDAIDNCDFYLLILGGRYGSLLENWMSYTEKEYRYAKEKGIPVLAFLHRCPENIPVIRSEQDLQKQQKLADFRNLVQKQTVSFWENLQELSEAVAASIIQQIEKGKALGWVRGRSSEEEFSGEKMESMVLRTSLTETALETPQIPPARKGNILYPDNLGYYTANILRSHRSGKAVFYELDGVIDLERIQKEEPSAKSYHPQETHWLADWQDEYKIPQGIGQIRFLVKRVRRLQPEMTVNDPTAEYRKIYHFRNLDFKWLEFKRNCTERAESDIK